MDLCIAQVLFFYEISIYVTSEMERDIWIVAFRHFIMYYDGTGILRTRKEHIFFNQIQHPYI